MKNLIAILALMSIGAWAGDKEYSSAKYAFTYTAPDGYQIEDVKEEGDGLSFTLKPDFFDVDYRVQVSKSPSALTAVMANNWAHFEEIKRMKSLGLDVQVDTIAEKTSNGILSLFSIFKGSYEDVSGLQVLKTYSSGDLLYIIKPSFLVEEKEQTEFSIMWSKINSGLSIGSTSGLSKRSIQKSAANEVGLVDALGRSATLRGLRSVPLTSQPTP